MTPRALLLTGLGLLVTGLLLVLAIDTDPAGAGGPTTALVQGYLSHACALVGTGLVVVAALLSSPRPRRPTEPPAVDHYA